MSLCVPDDLVLLTGTSLDTEILQAIIDQSDRQISARLAVMGISTPSSDVTLESASLNLSMAGVFIRLKADGSKASTVKVGDISITDTIENTVSNLEQVAYNAVDNYAKTHGREKQYRNYIRKVNG